MQRAGLEVASALPGQEEVNAVFFSIFSNKKICIICTMNAVTHHIMVTDGAAYSY
jgi:hypothetical protein